MKNCKGYEHVDYCRVMVDVCVWNNLKDVEKTDALGYQWDKSNNNALLLKSLSIDTRNIVSTYRIIPKRGHPNKSAPYNKSESTKNDKNPLNILNKCQTFNPKPLFESSEPQLQPSIICLYFKTVRGLVTSTER